MQKISRLRHHVNIRFSLRQLKVFQEIMRGGSAIVAAEAMNISQPAVSKLISSMEEDLRYPLFIRTGRGLEPTAEAISLYPFVERTLAEHQRLQNHAQNLRTGSSGLLRIAGNMTLINVLAASSVLEFRKDFPDVSVELTVLSGSEIQSAVMTKKADIGLLYGPFYSDIIASERIGNWPVLCAFNRGHPLERHDEICIRDLIDQEILTYSNVTPTGLTIRRAFENSDTPLNVAMVLSNTLGVLEMVRGGAGIGLIDYWQHWEGYFPSITCRPVHPRIENHPVMLLAPHNRQNAALERMASLIRAKANALS